MSELVAGAHVTPTIRLVRPLGAGGMGAVWVADHLTLRSQVVVKFMTDGTEKDDSQVARFSHEAAAASQVRSPHVVQVFDHGLTGDGTPFIVMELLEGQDLAARLARRGRMSLVDVVDLVEQVALALGRAHAANVVHRDVKPGNIFVCDRGDGRPFYKVLDFGIAKGAKMASLMGLATLTGTMVGTPAYASPEQLVGSREIDHRSDLWALGVVAFKALTGVLPYRADSLGSLVLKIHTTPPPRATDLVPELPSAVDDWLARAYAVAPTDRFASAKEMAEALASAANADAAPSTVATTIAASTEGPPSPDGARTGDVPADAMAHRPPTLISMPLAARAPSTNRQGDPSDETQTSLGIAADHVSPGLSDGAAKLKHLELTTGSPSSSPIERAWRAPRPLSPLLLGGGAALLVVAAGATLVMVPTPHDSASLATGLTSTPAPLAVPVAPATASASAALAASSLSTPATTRPIAPPLMPRSTPPPSTSQVAASPRPAQAPRLLGTPTVNVPEPPRPLPTPAPTPSPTNAGKLF